LNPRGLAVTSLYHTTYSSFSKFEINKKEFLIIVDGTHVALNMTFLYGGQCMHAGIHLAYTS
jgi:hypothetical protein